jgi:hypothetical protein
MYGYSYGCAAADVWHTVLHTAMLYPGYDVVGGWLGAAPLGLKHACCFPSFLPLCCVREKGTEKGCLPARPQQQPLLLFCGGGRWEALHWPRLSPPPPPHTHPTPLAEPPKVLHYGLLWNVPGTQYSFDKHWHYSFDPLSCPPWQIGWAAHGLAAGGGQAARWRGRRDGQGCQSTTCGGPLPVWEWGRGRDERPHH